MSASLGIRQSAWSTFHDAQAAGRRGRTVEIGVQDNLVRRVLECAERVALRHVRVAEQAYGVVGMCREHDGVEPVGRSGRRPDGDPGGAARHVHDGVPGTQRVRSQPLEDALHVRHRAAADRAPLERPADADETVMVEKAEEIVDRELVDPVGCSGPYCRRDRGQEVVPEAAPEPEVVEVTAQCLAALAPRVEPRPGIAVEAEHVSEHPPVLRVARLPTAGRTSRERRGN